MADCRQEMCQYWPGEGCLSGVMPCEDTACPESHMDSGDHSGSYWNGDGVCEWCAAVNRG